MTTTVERVRMRLMRAMDHMRDYAPIDQMPRSLLLAMGEVNNAYADLLHIPGGTEIDTPEGTDVEYVPPERNDNG